MATSVLFVLMFAFVSCSFAAPAVRLSFQLHNTASRLTPATNPTTPSTATTNEPGTTFCRQVHTPPSLCVDLVAFHDEDGVDFCPYRMCAPKYVEAELCPAEYSLAAKAKCLAEEITRDVYKCDHIYKKTKTEPAGCVVGPSNPDCKEVRYCSCLKTSDVTTNQLKFITAFEPYCGYLE